MAEDTEDNDTLLSGLETGDLTKDVYEGGFKTWECSIDLATLLINEPQTFLNSEGNMSEVLQIIEVWRITKIPRFPS